MDRDSIEQAIEQLYRLYYQPVLRHLERLVRQHESAEDLCQETFLRAFKHWDQLRDTTCVRSWLYWIATNTAVDYLRRQHRISVTTLYEETIRTTIAPIQAQWEDAEPVWEALRLIAFHHQYSSETPHISRLCSKGANYVRPSYSSQDAFVDPSSHCNRITALDDTRCRLCMHRRHWRRDSSESRHTASRVVASLRFADVHWHICAACLLTASVSGAVGARHLEQGGAHDRGGTPHPEQCQRCNVRNSS